MERQYIEFDPTSSPLSSYHEELARELAVEQRRRVAMPNLGGLGVKAAFGSYAINGAEQGVRTFASELGNSMAVIVGAPVVSATVERPKQPYPLAA